MKTVQFTRAQYLSNEVSHQEYYGQFVSDRLKAEVLETFGNAIAQSKDEHFNDIPLNRWDLLSMRSVNIPKHAIAQANGSGGVSLSDKVCTLKAAAQMIRAEKCECGADMVPWRLGKNGKVCKKTADKYKATYGVEVSK